MISIDRRAAKLFLILCKYLPIITALLLILHCCINLRGGNDIVFDNLVRDSITRAVFMFTASCALKFCYIHRCFILYNFIVSQIIIYHEEWGFNVTALPYIRFTIIGIGILLFILLYIYRRCFIREGSIRIFRNHGKYNY